MSGNLEENDNEVTVIKIVRHVDLEQPFHPLFTHQERLYRRNRADEHCYLERQTGTHRDYRRYNQNYNNSNSQYSHSFMPSQTFPILQSSYPLNSNQSTVPSNETVPLTKNTDTAGSVSQTTVVEDKKFDHTNCNLQAKANKKSTCTQTYKVETTTSSCQAVCVMQDEECQASTSLQDAECQMDAVICKDAKCQTTEEIKTSKQNNQIILKTIKDSSGNSFVIVGPRLLPVGLQVNNNLNAQENLRMGVSSTDKAQSERLDPKLSTASVSKANNRQQLSCPPPLLVPSNSSRENISTPVKREIRKRRQVKEERKQKIHNFVDPQYYLDDDENMYYQCKLCNFNKKKIVEHYVKNHPESEVLIARLGKTAAKDAIDSVDDEPNDDNFKLYCRFCKYDTVDINKFLDHTTTHTGEFRYKCGYCQLKGSYCLNVRNHFLNVHFKDLQSDEKKQFKCQELYKVSLTEEFLLPGYICTGCNFVQLSSKNVEKHIQKFHPTSTKEDLFKNINFARFDPACNSKETTLEQFEEDNTSIIEHQQTATSPQSLKRSCPNKETSEANVNSKRVSAPSTSNYCEGESSSDTAGMDPIIIKVYSMTEELQ